MKGEEIAHFGLNGLKSKNNRLFLMLRHSKRLRFYSLFELKIKIKLLQFNNL